MSLLNKSISDRRRGVIVAAVLAALALAVALALAGPSANREPADDGVQAASTRHWGEIVAGDEFEGDAVDESKWERYGDYAGHAGNGRRLKEQDTVADGHLTISGEADGDTGGIAWRQGQTYGRWEARMRVIAENTPGHAYHPVLLLWPDADNWPAGGELDYAETDAGTTTLKAFVHYGDGTIEGAQDPYLVEHPVDLTRWHNYALEWAPDHISGYLDGIEWFRDTNPAAQPPAPMHETIQLDDFFPQGDLTPAHMDVAWVRMYSW